MGDPYKAMQCFRKATHLKGSEDPDVLLNIALVLRHAQELDGAVEVIDRAVALAPNGVLYLYIRGEICFELGRYDQALKDFQAALMISPKFIAVRSRTACSAPCRVHRAPQSSDAALTSGGFWAAFRRRSKRPSCRPSCFGCSASSRHGGAHRVRRLPAPMLPLV